MAGSMSEEKPDALAHMPGVSDHYLESYPPDVLLVVKGQEFLCHGAFLSLSSRFFSKLLNDCRNNPQSKVDGKVVLRVEESAEDVELMLSLLYNSRLWLNSVSGVLHL